MLAFILADGLQPECGAEPSDVRNNLEKLAVGRMLWIGPVAGRIYLNHLVISSHRAHKQPPCNDSDLNHLRFAYF